MRILHVVEPLAGGMVTFLKSLVESMPYDTHLIIHGERQFVMPVKLAKKELLYPNVKFIKWKSAQRSIHLQKDLTASAELYHIIKRLQKTNGFNIVHLHSSKGGFIGRVVCRLLGLQDIVLYTPNGAPFMAGKSTASNLFYKSLEKFGSLLGGQVVCCSPSEQKAYEVAGIKAISINNGIKSKPENAQAPLVSVKDSLFRVVTAGRIVDQKNPALFNSIANYFEDLPQFEFVWIGDGTDRHLITAKNVHVTGWLKKEEVDTLVSNADLYLSAANFEGLPFSVLEALALRKPVLLSDCIGNKDLIKKGLNGSIFNTCEEAINCILHFYNNASMLSVMGDHSGSHCSTSFNQNDTHQHYKKLYKTTADANVEIVHQNS